jgi:hypothetical protein
MDQEGAPFFYNPEKNFMAHEKDIPLSTEE